LIIRDCKPLICSRRPWLLSWSSNAILGLVLLHSPFKRAHAGNERARYAGSDASALCSLRAGCVLGTGAFRGR
jgi:hypothetical protein